MTKAAKENVFAPLLKMQKEYKDALAKDARRLIQERLKEFFEEWPKVMAVQWRQYTPSFNDGDACVFTISGPEVSFINNEERKETDFLCPYNVKSVALKEAVKALEEEWAVIEDLCKAAFDEGLTITVSRDGEVESEEYYAD